MPSGGGGSVAQWRVISQLRSYVAKVYPAVQIEYVQKEVEELLKWVAKSTSVKDNTSSQSCQPLVDELDTKANKKIEELSSESVKVAPQRVKYNEALKAFVSLNTFIPQIQTFDEVPKSDITVAPVKRMNLPTWRMKKRDAITKGCINSRTRHLLRGLDLTLSDETMMRRLDDLNSHIKLYPDTKGVAVKSSGISRLLHILHKSPNTELQCQAREALALIGYITPVKAHGIRILAIDGGGTRGLVALEILRHIEKEMGQPIHELFDFVCGVSTGAIVAVLIAAHQMPLDDCEDLYRRISNQVFSQNSFKGTAGLVWRNSYYDSDAWSKILQDHMGDVPLIDTVKDQHMPKLCLVSTQANTSWVRPFLFRNYVFPVRSASHFTGSNQPQMWEAVRASAAAPGYFSEYNIGDLALLDGGVLVNNPTSIAIHEARQLWPLTPMQTVISVGTGRHEPLLKMTDANIRWKDRIRSIVNSATDTEGVHTTLHDLLPGDVYYRFNPYLAEEINLDEIRQEKLALMLEDTGLYIRRNDNMFNQAFKSLGKPKNLVDKVKDNFSFRKHLWEVWTD